MKKFIYLTVLALILGLALTGCSLLSNVGQVPVTEQSGIAYLTKALPLTNLVGLWHFDGDATDSSGNGNDGILQGDVGFDTGMFGQALSVDGAGEYVDVGDIGVTGDWTVEFWANLGSASATIYYPIGLSLGSPNGKGIFVGGTYAPTAGKWGVYDGTNWILGSDVYTDTWYHFAVTKSGTTYTLYRGAAYENSGALTDIDISDLDIGRRSEDVWYFDGLIDEVRIWDTALTADKLGQFYDFDGLLSPYVGPPKAFKRGRSIPLKWKYADLAGIVVDSSLAVPRVRILPTGGDPPEVTGEAIVVEDPGESGLRYDSNTDMWIFNWQTKEYSETSYEIYITSFQTGQTNGPFEICLK